MTTITIHERATEEQVQRALKELEELLVKFGVAEWKREGRKIIFDRAIDRQEKGAFLMVPRVISVTME